MKNGKAYKILTNSNFSFRIYFIYVYCAMESRATLNVMSTQNVFSDLEVLAAIFAAAVHDVDHPGYTN